jgi:vancomycin permeability regulator SanA
VILVLGHKLLPSGEASEEFQNRIRRGLELFAAENADWLVISGGKTRAEFSSEAQIGQRFIPFHLEWKTVLETQSRTTFDTFRLTPAYLESMDISVTAITVVTSAYHVPRAQRIMARLWPRAYACAKFDGVGSVSPWHWFTEKLHLILLGIDPEGTWLVPVLAKGFRNA